MYKLVFWFLLFWTLVSLFLYIRGYDVLTSLMLVLVVDMVSLGVIVQMGSKGPMKEISSEVATKLDNIEKVCQSILSSSSDDSIVAKIEERISKQKDDVNYLLDRMSRKMLELEEKINKFGFGLAEHLDEKVDEKKYDENSFNVGETVYVEDEFASVEEDSEE
jgi:hypothetical protein